MIQHILKIIWTERKANLLLLLEFVFIFCILWFCSDYLTFMFRRYMQPVGFDIENTYLVSISPDEEKLAELITETGKTKDEINQKYGWIIYNRIKQNPSVEYASLSAYTYPYNGGFNSMSLEINKDTIPVKNIYERYISPEYLDVFKVKLESGRALTWDDNASKLMITGDEQDKIGEHYVADVTTVRNPYRPAKGEQSVIGVLNKMKRDPFYPYYNEAYGLFPNDLLAYLSSGQAVICIRIKESVNKTEFIDNFTDEMYDQISVGPYFLSQVQSFEDVKEQYMTWNSYANDFKSIFAIVAFLLINIFLGIIGTFWFRMRERRSEIGLRMALGSTRGKLQGLFIGETLILVLIASIVATLICVNIGMADIVKDLGVPIARRGSDANLAQYFINFGVTFSTLAIITILAVWYPARGASKVKPAIALHEE